MVIYFTLSCPNVRQNSAAFRVLNFRNSGLLLPTNKYTGLYACQGHGLTNKQIGISGRINANTMYACVFTSPYSLRLLYHRLVLTDALKTPEMWTVTHCNYNTKCSYAHASKSACHASSSTIIRSYRKALKSTLYSAYARSAVAWS